MFDENKRLRNELNCKQINNEKFAYIMGISERRAREILDGYTPLSQGEVEEIIRTIDEFLFHEKWEGLA